MRLISFELSGEFAEFSDPSVTSNQTVYYIPSKSAIIGIIGAIIGIKRNNVGPAKWYNDDFLDLLYETNIGIKMLSEPKKFAYFSNNVSLKETKKKPYKREVLIEPKFKIYLTSEKYLDQIIKVIKNREFVFSPFLGHAYCHARIENLKEYNDVKKLKSIPSSAATSCVVLDEGESYNENFMLVLEPISESRIIIERHLHHFNENNLQQTSKLLGTRVLKHWIPIGDSEFKILKDDKRNISKFVNVGGSIVCLY